MPTSRRPRYSPAAPRSAGHHQGIPPVDQEFRSRASACLGRPSATARRWCARRTACSTTIRPMALAFDSDVADGSQAPQLLLFGGPLTPCDVNNPVSTLTPRMPLPDAWAVCRHRSLTCRTSSASTRHPIPRPSGSTRITCHRIRRSRWPACRSAIPRRPTSSTATRTRPASAIEQDLGHGTALTLQSTSMADAACTGPSTQCGARAQHDAELAERHDRSQVSPSTRKPHSSISARRKYRRHQSAVNADSLSSLHPGRTGQLLPAGRIESHA